ncbi:hypothetical protein HUW51_23905 [Adhaeribacter swui]|uniref:DUF4138 domain-containing protein n=1 Tax=Adhaeribacter swui TaxID=2086471 RepID=A0A7G7GEL8_9BACT|nr:hypothetical protein [Adhaeribacter swui]QNF35602.1 hypothetical protein HUW51_23905 [Adhaeribacter swui]
MKKLHQLLFCLILITTAVFSAKAQEPDVDELAADKIAIVKNNSKTSKAFKISGTPANLLAAFGKPKSKTVEFAEMDQVDFTVYRYNGGEFSFYADTLYYFRITGPAFQVLTPKLAGGSAKYTLKVGDQTSKMKTVYPKTYQARNSENVFFFWLYQLSGSNKATRTRLERGLGIFTTNGRITDIVYEE